ncbi:MAG: hypothetical protein ACK46Q_01415 [Hyphomonas sp.]
MRKQLLTTAALILAALPASAETWGVSDAPVPSGDGKWMCMLWHGKTAPLMNITIMTDRNFISVAAPQFAAVPDRTPTTFTYPSGRSGAGVIRKAEPQSSAVFVLFPDEALDPILDQFRTGGTFTLTAGDASASFPVPAPGLGSGIAPLKDCAARFPETPGTE